MGKNVAVGMHTIRGVNFDGVLFEYVGRETNTENSNASKCKISLVCKESILEEAFRNEMA